MSSENDTSDFYELIKVEKRQIGEEILNSINARDLYKALELKQDFSDWIKAQIKSLFLEENIDYVKYQKHLEKGGRGRPSIEYIITLYAAKHISMASRTLKGKQIRDYFIEVERSYREKTPEQELIEMFRELKKAQDKVIKEKDEKEEILKQQLIERPLLKLSHALVQAIKAKATEGVPLNRNPHLLKYTTFITAIGLHPYFAKKNADELLKDLGIIYRSTSSFRSDYREGVEKYDGHYLFIYPHAKHRHHNALCIHPDGILTLGVILHEENEKFCEEHGLNIEYKADDFINAYNRVKQNQIVVFK